MRLRFSIRDLLWLTAHVAMLVAWWIDRSHLASELERYAPSEFMIHQVPAVP